MLWLRCHGYSPWTRNQRPSAVRQNSVSGEMRSDLSTVSERAYCSLPRRHRHVLPIDRHGRGRLRPPDAVEHRRGEGGRGDGRAHGRGGGESRRQQPTAVAGEFHQWDQPWIASERTPRPVEETLCRIVVARHGGRVAPPSRPATRGATRPGKSRATVKGYSLQRERTLAQARSRIGVRSDGGARGGSWKFRGGGFRPLRRVRLGRADRPGAQGRHAFGEGALGGRAHPRPDRRPPVAQGRRIRLRPAALLAGDPRRLARHVGLGPLRLPARLPPLRHSARHPSLPRRQAADLRAAVRGDRLRVLGHDTDAQAVARLDPDRLGRRRGRRLGTARHRRPLREPHPAPHPVRGRVLPRHHPRPAHGGGRRARDLADDQAARRPAVPGPAPVASLPGDGRRRPDPRRPLRREPAAGRRRQRGILPGSCARSGTPSPPTTGARGTSL